MKHIGGLFDKVARKALAKHGGQVMAELARVWPELCPELAGFARPEAIKRTGPGPATLKLRVQPARALEAQMMADVLTERINTHFGQRVIARVTLVQAPLPAPASARVSTPQTEPDEALLAELRKGLNNVQDEKLRAALARMAEGIARKAARLKNPSPRQANENSGRQGE